MPKNKKSLSKKEKERKIKELLELRLQLEEKERAVKEANPFWYYEPTTGNISEQKWDFLRKHLKPEDIPQTLVGQIDAHKSTAPIRGFSGGNQSGKTAGGIIDMLIQITGEVPLSLQGIYPEERLPKDGKPRYWRIVSIDIDNGITRNIIPSLKQWVPKEYLLNGSFEKSYSAGQRTLRLYRNNTEFVGQVELMSNKQDVEDFQGPARHGMLYDEEPRKEIRKENLLRFTTSRVNEIFCMTPTRGLSWVVDLFTQSSDGKNRVDWFKFPSVVNPKTSLDSLEEIIKDLDSYEEVKMRILGEFISLTGLVYGRLFDERIHVIEPFETGCTCGRVVHMDHCPYNLYLGYLGCDCHTVKDSCSVMGFIDREDNFYVDTCYKRGVDAEQYGTDQRKMMHGKRMDWAVFDPSNDSSITAFRGLNIYKLAKKGLGVRSFKGDKYKGSIAAGVHTIKQRLKLNSRSGRPSIYIFNRPENQELIRSFKTLQRESWANEDVKGMKDKIAEGIHDHHAALRYIMQNRLRWRPNITHDPQPPIPDSEAMLL